MMEICIEIDIHDTCSIKDIYIFIYTILNILKYIKGIYFFTDWWILTYTSSYV